MSPRSFFFVLVLHSLGDHKTEISERAERRSETKSAQEEKRVVEDDPVASGSEKVTGVGVKGADPAWGAGAIEKLAEEGETGVLKKVVRISDVLTEGGRREVGISEVLNDVESNEEAIEMPATLTAVTLVARMRMEERMNRVLSMLGDRLAETRREGKKR